MSAALERIFPPGSIEYVTLDGDLRITGSSPGAARLAHEPGAVTPGEDVRSGFPEFAGAESDLRDVLAGRRLSWSIQGVCRPGVPGSPLYTSATVRLQGGKPSAPPALVVHLEDVTGWMRELQRRTQTSNDALLLMHTLTATKAFVEKIFDSMAELLVVTSPSGLISAVNSSAAGLSGYQSAELIGRPVADLLPGLDDVPFAACAPGIDSLELDFKTRGGGLIPAAFSRSLLDSDGEPSGVVYVGRDLRELKKAEARISRLETEKTSLQDFLSGTGGAENIVCSSPEMDALMGDVRKVAQTDTTVLILGETGTGKELIARAIHRLSARKDKPMITVNCAALTPGLVESEIFGHEKGAFTGALERRIGRFELADGGTIFFDEIGELPPETQATLLRVLQEQSFERVGGTQTVRVNVRLLAATNRDLESAARGGGFRSDLLFRLNVFPLRVPPLRSRSGDIPVLADYFVRLFARRANKPVKAFSGTALSALARYAWPGNVRELANVIERAMIVCEGNRIDEKDLALPPAQRPQEEHAGTFDDVARKHILQVLEECGGVIEGPGGAAATLGLNPGTLRSRLKKLGIGRSGGRFILRRSSPGRL